jgi:hypothetical protein
MGAGSRSAGLAGPVALHYQWRWELSNAGDEMVQEAAPPPGGSIEEATDVTTKVTTFSLRLPLSLKAAVEPMAEEDGTSMNQFLVMAAAEKLTALRTAEAFFAERRGRGDRNAAIRFLKRAGGEAPRPEDERPD